MIVAFLLFVYGDTLLMTLIGFIFLGITSGANTTLPNAFWAEFFGTKYLGTIKAAAAAAMVLGSAIGPAITGLLLDFDISLDIQYVGISIFFAFSSALMLIGISQSKVHLSK
jgi:MFS family permease